MSNDRLERIALRRAEIEQTILNKHGVTSKGKRAAVNRTPDGRMEIFGIPVGFNKNINQEGRV